MSFEVIRMVLNGSQSRKFARLVLLELAGTVNEEDRKRQGTAECYPSIGYLGRQTGLAYRTVWDQLRNLRDLKEITWRNRRGHSNIYTIHVPFDDDGTIR
jgi:hypothetical protein